MSWITSHDVRGLFGGRGSETQEECAIGRSNRGRRRRLMEVEGRPGRRVGGPGGRKAKGKEASTGLDVTCWIVHWSRSPWSIHEQSRGIPRNGLD